MASPEVAFDLWDASLRSSYRDRAPSALKLKHPKETGLLHKSLDRRLEAIVSNPQSKDFILADAKDADMAFGIAAPGTRPDGTHPSLAEYRTKIRDVVKQGVVDIVIMSASTNELLALDERLFDNSTVTPAARANDTSDIWLPRKGSYASAPSRCFRSATLDHIQCGKSRCTEKERTAGTNLGLYSMTFNNDLQHDHATLEAFKLFRIEAEEKGFRYFLEVFAPNMDGAVPAEDVGAFLNDHIARALAGVTRAGRPLFLKIPYFGPRALEELVAYDPSMVPGILGGASGTTMDAFTLLAKAKKHGGRAALFGRKINNAEDQLLMIELLRRIADSEIAPEDAVRAYHDGLKQRGITPIRSIESDSRITAPELLL